MRIPCIPVWIKAMLTAIILVLLVKTFAFTSCTIPSTGMENSLYQGERVLVNKWSYGFRVPFSIWRWLGKTAGKGDIVMFDQLDKESIFKIIDLELSGFYKRVETLGYHLTITDDAKNFIAEKGYDIQFGARPLKRAIQKYLEDKLAEMIIRATVQEGDTIVVDFDKENQKIVSSIHNSQTK